MGDFRETFERQRQRQRQRQKRDLDSIRNSCDVFFLSHLLNFLHKTLGQPHMTAADLAVWVNDKLELVEEDHYSARTMVSWLHLCGFKVSTEYYRLLQSVTECYRVLQSVKEC